MATSFEEFRHRAMLRKRLPPLVAVMKMSGSAASLLSSPTGNVLKTSFEATRESLDEAHSYGSPRAGRDGDGSESSIPSTSGMLRQREEELASACELGLILVAEVTKLRRDPKAERDKTSESQLLRDYCTVVQENKKLKQALYEQQVNELYAEDEATRARTEAVHAMAVARQEREREMENNLFHQLQSIRALREARQAEDEAARMLQEAERRGRAVAEEEQQHLAVHRLHEELDRAVARQGEWRERHLKAIQETSRVRGVGLANLRDAAERGLMQRCYASLRLLVILKGLQRDQEKDTEATAFAMWQELAERERLAAHRHMQILESVESEWRGRVQCSSVRSLQRLRVEAEVALLARSYMRLRIRAMRGREDKAVVECTRQGQLLEAITADLRQEYAVALQKSLDSAEEHRRHLCEGGLKAICSAGDRAAMTASFVRLQAYAVLRKEMRDAVHRQQVWNTKACDLLRCSTERRMLATAYWCFRSFALLRRISAASAAEADAFAHEAATAQSRLQYCLASTDRAIEVLQLLHAECQMRMVIVQQESLQLAALSRRGTLSLTIAINTSAVDCAVRAVERDARRSIAEQFIVELKQMHATYLAEADSLLTRDHYAYLGLDISDGIVVRQDVMGLGREVRFTASGDDFTEVDGVRVVDVRDGGPADVAGLKCGDIIYSLAGQHIARCVDFKRTYLTLLPGEAVEALFLRKHRSPVPEKYMALRATLRPEATAAEMGRAKRRVCHALELDYERPTADDRALWWTSRRVSSPRRGSPSPSARRPSHLSPRGACTVFARIVHSPHGGGVPRP